MTKTVFIPVNEKVKVTLKQLNLLPQKISLLINTQFLNQTDDIIKQLKEKDIICKKNPKTKNLCEILGCSFPESDCDAYLYIGLGKFHPKIVSYTTKKTVFCFDPYTSTMTKIQPEKPKKGPYVKFLSTDNIGILISTKPGQHNTQNIEKLKKKFENKTYFEFLFDTLDFLELENFPFIDCWVNTACPRIGLDDTIRTKKTIINIDQILAGLE